MSGTPWTSVACGGFHTCAITGSLSAGEVFCWGNNSSGQLGINSTTDSHTPVQVPGLSGITQLALGWNHSCALRADGSVFCWGNNIYGQVGNGSFANALTPVKLPLTNIQQISSGSFTTCARRADGTVWCWGSDALGTVGDGTGAGTIGSGGVNAPVQVMGLPPSASITLGTNAACSQGTDLSLECWGEAEFNEFGNGSTSNQFVPIPIQL
jgi:hypothetical protein